jgi:protease I
MSFPKNKIGVLIESHFDEIEFRAFNEFFPANGYELVYISHLWGQPSITFEGINLVEHITVEMEVSEVDLNDYIGIILIGAYAMDRLRYEVNPQPGQPNRAPAVEFLRRAVAAMDAGRLKIGTICHSLWLFTADPKLLENRQVTCAHNILADVQNAGAQVVFDGNQTRPIQVDGNLITAKHPDYVHQFMEVFSTAVSRTPSPSIY